MTTNTSNPRQTLFITGQVLMYEQLHMSEEDMLKVYEFMRSNPKADWNEIHSFVERNCPTHSRDLIEHCAEPVEAAHSKYPNHKGLLGLYNDDGDELPMDLNTQGKDVKENRTLAALSNLLGCRVEEIHGDLPPLGEAGEVRLPIETLSHDEERFTVTEDVYLNFNRLPSGRIGRWRMTSIDADESSPTFGERIIATGKGQFKTTQFKL